MSEKTDNPRDHGHSDYNSGGLIGFLGLVIAAIALMMGVAASCRLDEVEKRFDNTEVAECGDDPDCLRDLVGDR